MPTPAHQAYTESRFVTGGPLLFPQVLPLVEARYERGWQADKVETVVIVFCFATGSSMRMFLRPAHLVTSHSKHTKSVMLGTQNVASSQSILSRGLWRRAESPCLGHVNVLGLFALGIYAEFEDDRGTWRTRFFSLRVCWCGMRYVVMYAGLARCVRNHRPIWGNDRANVGI